MTNQEILKNISNIAFKKGCRNYLVYHFKDKDLKDSLDWEDYYGLIFSHDFAKAFWGERYIYNFPRGKKIDSQEEIPCEHFELGSIVSWQYNLQQMVLEPEPLKYLEKFL